MMGIILATKQKGAYRNYQNYDMIKSRT